MASGDRKRGLIMVVAAVVAAAAWAGFLAVLKDHDIVRNPRVFKVLGFPLGGAAIVALFGLAKLVLGRTLAEIGQGWDDLKGWPRGLLGTFIVGIAVAMIVTVVGFAIAVMM
jgi:hypothetical protein